MDAKSLRMDFLQWAEEVWRWRGKDIKKAEKLCLLVKRYISCFPILALTCQCFPLDLKAYKMGAIVFIYLPFRGPVLNDEET